MDPAIPSITISDVVVSTAGRDQGQLYYVIDTEDQFLMLVNGKDRTLDKPKRKKRKQKQLMNLLININLFLKNMKIKNYL